MASSPMIGEAVAAADDPSWRHRFADVNGVRLHYTDAGTGPLVVLLHGFPEFWYAWRRQIPRLVAAGYRVIAPDMRGYNLSAKPPQVAAYGLRTLADDICALIASAGAERASVVGHDWGAVVAWAAAMRHPARVERLAALNGAHPLKMLMGLLEPQQLYRSRYILSFQLPWLPEHAVRKDGAKVLFKALDHASVGWASIERDAYREAFEMPGAIRAMIHYYRALFRPTTALWPRPVDVPALVLWGERDPYLGRGLAQPGPAWAPNTRVEFLPELGHFIHHEAPDLISDLLITFLNAGGKASRSSGEASSPSRVRAE